MARHDDDDSAHPFSIQHLPQPPIVRVRAIFVMCDLREAVWPYFQPDRQELKLKRLEDLVNAMLQWATIFEGGAPVNDLKQAQDQRPRDPTMALFKHLRIPPWKNDDPAEMDPRALDAFLQQRTVEPYKIGKFLQVRLLIDPEKIGEADAFNTKENAADLVKNLVKRAEHLKLDKGLSEPDMPVDFMPFANDVETVKGVVYWPLTASNLKPSDRAKLLIELTKRGFYENKPHVRIKMAREYVHCATEHAFRRAFLAFSRLMTPSFTSFRTDPLASSVKISKCANMSFTSR